MKYSKWFAFLLSLLFVTLMLAAFVAPVAAAPLMQDPTPTPPVNQSILLLIPVLVGSVGIPLVNALKKSFGWTTPADKQKNIWLTFGVAAALAVVLMLITNSFVPLSGPETVVSWITAVFSVMTLVYKQFNETPKPEDPEGEQR